MADDQNLEGGDDEYSVGAIMGPIIRKKLQETDYFQKAGKNTAERRRQIREDLHSILVSKLKDEMRMSETDAKVNATIAMMHVIAEMKEGGGKRKSKKRKSRKSHKKKRKSNRKKSRKSKNTKKRSH